MTTDGEPTSPPDPESEAGHPKRHKRKQSKAPRGEDQPAPDNDERRIEAPDPAFERRERRKTAIWMAVIGVLLTVELYVFGKNGYIDVCVGRDGVTDFGLVGKSATPETGSKAPLCERRHNLGMRSHYDEELKTGLRQACQRANAVFGTHDVTGCIHGKDRWAHWITSEQVPPWHEAFYKQMLWFLF